MTAAEAPAATVAWTFQADADELIRAIRNVALFASTDDTLPSLTCVHFRMIDDVQVVEASDRYVAAQQLIRSGKGRIEDMCVYAEPLVKACAELTRAVGGVKAFRLPVKPQLLLSGTTEEPWKLTLTISPARCTAEDAVLHTSVGIDTGMNPWPADSIDRIWDAEAKRAKKPEERFGGEWRLGANNLTKLAALDDGAPRKRHEAVTVILQFCGDSKPVQVGLQDAAFRALVMPIGKARS